MDTAQQQQQQQQQQTEHRPKLTGGGAATSDSKYVVMLENFEGGNVYGKPLGRSCRRGMALRFASAVATRMALGHDYRPGVDGDVFYDPVINGEEPRDEYLRWMTDGEAAALKPEENMGGVFVAGIVHVSDAATLLRGCRRIKRRYCVYDTELTVFDLMEMETEGDQELARLMHMPLPPLGAPEAQAADQRRSSSSSALVSVGGGAFDGGVTSTEVMARKYLPPCGSAALRQPQPQQCARRAVATPTPQTIATTTVIEEEPAADA